jgi:hypothetical protein
MSKKLLRIGSLTDAGRAGVACAAIALATMGGCGTSDEAPERTGFVTDSVTATDFAGAPSEAHGPAMDPTSDEPVLRAELEARGGTDVVGSVSLTPRSGGTTVSVVIHGANSGLPYVAELIGGSCASPGAVIAALGEITAGEAGDGEFHRVVDTSLLRADQANRAVRVRGAGDPTAIVACGNLGSA